MKIYVASSWRNTRQPHVVQALRDAGHEVFDFKHPQEILPNGHLGDELEDVTFGWNEIDEGYKGWSNEDYINALNTQTAALAYEADHGGMEWSEAGVLVLPCGASAHTEIGYYDGAGKPAFVLLPEDGLVVELMYKSFAICPTLDNLVERVNARDPGKKFWRITASVSLDIEVDITLESPVTFDSATEVAQRAAESELSEFRSEFVTSVDVIEVEAYRVERTKK